MNQYTKWKVGEAIAASQLKPGGSSGLGFTPLNQPAYFADASGAAITTIVCGKPYTFQVPGYSQVWLKLTKNGKTTYDAAFNVPMPAYTSSCFRDPGVYVATVLDVNTKALIGTANLTVTGGLFGLSTTTLVILGAGAFLVLRKRK